MIIHIKSIEDIIKKTEGVSNKRLSAFVGKGNTKSPLSIEEVKSMPIQELKQLINEKGLTIRKTRS